MHLVICQDLSIFPRLEYASEKSGLSSIALRVDTSASFKLPDPQYISTSNEH